MLKAALAFLLVASLFSPFKLFGRVFHPAATVADYASNSVVRIDGTAEEDTLFGPMLMGYACTGFQIQPTQILTANHCVHEDMRADGHTPKVLRTDGYYDLALLEVKESKRPLLSLRDYPLDRGEKLVAIGYANGFPLLTQLDVKVLQIAFTPNFDKIPPGIYVSPGYIGGMSGGPVIDAYGQVVGMVQRGMEDNQGYGVGTEIMRAFLVGSKE